MKKRFLSAALAACMLLGSAAALPQGTFTDSVSITASAVTEGDFTYVLSANNKYALITKYNNTSNTTCTIPDKLGTVPVEVIGAEAFKGKTKLQRVTVPTSLRVISSNAFENCTALTVVDGLRNTQLTSVSDYAFKGCTNMRSINFPKTLEMLGLNVCENCSLLERVIGLQNTKVDSLNGTFRNCKKLSSIFFPSTVKTLTNGAFENNSALTTIDLSGCTGLKAIGNNAFKGCTNLKTVYMPSSLETLGEYAFYDCKYLTGEYMFKNCKSL
ncbi:MAG: leucine-rich repeat domain-containing protein, partial [Ruminococcus sp.]|nr:leucine-rich repeat domain-containing protein [Ruminococcus sp.]